MYLVVRLRWARPVLLLMQCRTAAAAEAHAFAGRAMDDVLGFDANQFGGAIEHFRGLNGGVAAAVVVMMAVVVMVVGSLPLMLLLIVAGSCCYIVVMVMIVGDAAGGNNHV